LATAPTQVRLLGLTVTTSVLATRAGLNRTVRMKNYLARIDVELADILLKERCICGNYGVRINYGILIFIDFMDPRTT
jgi:hypothetical protein